MAHSGVLARRGVLAAGLAGAWWPARAAEPWPGRPVRVIHGFGPGGNPDLVGRILAAGLSEKLGQPFVVEGRPGASGIPASELVTRQSADGHTLLILTAGHGVSAALAARLPYDAVRDFSFITQLTEYPLLVVTRPDHPAADMAQMLAMARARPLALFWGSGGGRATTQGLSGEMIGLLAEARMTQVNYLSVAAAHADLAAGRLDWLVDTPTTLLGQVQAGRMRPLAVTGAGRYAPLPAVPTLREAGLAGYEAVSWVGLAGPPGMAPELVARINAECGAVLRESDAAQRLAALGSEVRFSTPASFRDRVASDVARWTEVVARAGLERQ